MNRKPRQADRKPFEPGPPPGGDVIRQRFADAVALHQAGRLGEAEPIYRRILADHPTHAGALHLIGVVALQHGRLDAAVKAIRGAIALNPRDAAYHSNLGLALGGQGRSAAAMACFRTALALKPDYAEAHNNLGGLLNQLGRPDEALAPLRRAIELKRDYAEAYNNLGNAHQAEGRLEEALGAYRDALGLRPDYPEALNNRAVALAAKQRRDEEKVARYRAAATADPERPEAHNNLGAALHTLGRVDAAVACYRRAVTLKPDYLEAQTNLGLALLMQGEVDEAAAHCRLALKVKPDFANAHNNLSLALLARGDLAAGWEHYEWRWRTQSMINERPTYPQPQWRGEPAAGKTLLIHDEQGFGDTLQFCRYAPLAAARGLRVILKAPRPLVRLLRDLPGIERVVAAGDPTPAFDLYCPMLSLPLAFGTTLETIPAARYYLRAEPRLAEAWRTRLAAPADPRPRVGLAWAGNPGQQVDSRRSIAPENLTPLFDLPRVRLFSLQKDGPKAPPTAPLRDFMREMGDFADTAAFIANLDLVISVDSAVAHLAAALGKPVWLMNRYDSCWRWLVGRDDSPWYPTLRLYRQPRPGDWDSVLAAIGRDLHGLAAQNAQS